MTIEEKAKAFDEAIEKVKPLHERAKKDDSPIWSTYEYLFPQLAESEDERIRKELVNFLQSPFIKENLTDEKVAPWLAYLEKQKDLASIPDELVKNYKLYCENSRREIREVAALINAINGINKQKEQKPAEFTHHETNESLEEAVTHQMEDDGDVDDFVRKGIDDVILKYAKLGAKWQKEHQPVEWEWPNLSNCIKNCKKCHGKCFYRKEPYEEQKPVPISCGHENGKTPDFVFSKQEYESSPIISKDTTSVKPVEFDGKALLYTADKSYQIGFRDGVASVKPTEWNEEDERRRDGIIQWLREYQKKFNPKYDSLSIESIDSLIDWLKSLHPSWKLSEEKRKETLDGVDIGYGLEAAIDILENGFTHYQTDRGEYERKQALDVLIFLLNETRKKEDAKLWSKDIVESIVTWATEKLQLYSMKESTPYVEAVKNNAQKVLDWAKEQWPIYYGWKPSEEQMEALEKTIRLANFGLEEDRRKVLISLYEQLKKLM